jgi:hypothetical protein
LAKIGRAHLAVHGALCVLFPILTQWGYLHGIVRKSPYVLLFLAAQGPCYS